jgi:hypothetical protein
VLLFLVAIARGVAGQSLGGAAVAAANLSSAGDREAQQWRPSELPTTVMEVELRDGAVGGAMEIGLDLGPNEPGQFRFFLTHVVASSVV